MDYQSLGASSQKEDVHAAIKDSGSGGGLFPGAFCKVIPDMLTGDDESCLIFHADGAGTKSIIAYLRWRESGDPAVFQGISQDALVMNIDDIACTGLVDSFIVSNTIGRNKFLVDANVIAAVIRGYETMAAMLEPHGIHVHSCGGETADVGDLVRTIIIDSTVMSRGKRSDIIDASNVVPGDVMVGLSSTGQASYEPMANSGISSNGITLARHAVLEHGYAETYPEILDPHVDASMAYQGRFHLDDPLPGEDMTIADALLSPTRTYTPILKRLLYGDDASTRIQDVVHGIIHVTGGGQTKCLNFGKGIRYVKDDLFETPRVFRLIKEEGNVEWEEMYRVFNMGHRMEIACTPDFAPKVIAASKSFGVEAKVIGRVEESTNPGKNELVISSPAGEISYGP
ncbi:phosphoribosylformylglycinamidine cyclo-ligase [Candidatus Bathyarchaeota archaeon]|nr:phosphoribosylformylglycinamidine cyclo-ligase [Candidatus Bathyarchaeota archaeon]